MREIHEPAPLLRVIRAKCLDCSAGVESEIRKYAPAYASVYTLRPETPSEETEQDFAREHYDKLRTILPFARFRDPREALGELRKACVLPRQALCRGW